MNTHIEKWLTAAVLLSGTSLASAHGASGAAGSVAHYLNSPDHLALLGLAALATGFLFLRRGQPCARKPD